MQQKADPLERNYKDLTPKLICDGLKDKELRITMEGLLNMTNSSTKVVRNQDVKEEKKQAV